ncbi:MAG TPA: CpsD/CapB family tyrosine-protein kinase [Chthoniobacterales bacterium]|jgi:capsular exopolysaccharide synthesis family protein
MSRIHEALKKAAQDRATQSPTAVTADLVDGAAEINRHIEPPPDVLLGAERVRLEAPVDPRFKESRILTYEELVKRCTRPQWTLDARNSVFVGADSDRVGAERFRTLRSRLYQIAGTQQLKKLLITSSIPAEGKTFVAANLAQSIVRQPDRRVLLIDADLRASRLHQTLGAPSGPGLSDYLRGEVDEFAIIQNGLEGNLCFIPGGQQAANPSELLLRDKMKHLLDTMATVFDWIIIDSPPALPVHDASMLADQCDGVLFVVRAGSTDSEIAQRVSAEFREKNLLGIVLNRVDSADSYNSYYYYYGSDSKNGAPGR